MPPRNLDLLSELEGSDPLNEPTTPLPFDPTAICPNLPASIHSVPYRLAIIGEAPGEDEMDQRRPFVGYSGRELDRFLSRFGILRDACFVGNVCNHRPPQNKIAMFDWDGPEITAGLKKLHEDLANFKPNCVLLLGGSALHAFKNPTLSPKKRKDKDGLKFVFPDSISDWRGSFFFAGDSSPLPGVKCIASFHPAACLRQYEWTPLLMMDIQRAFSEAATKELLLPEEEFDVEINFDRICNNLDDFYSRIKRTGADIEGYWEHWKCIAFAESRKKAFAVPFTDMSGQNLWSVDQELILFSKVTRILSDPSITKIWQNGLYDRWVLQWAFNIVCRGPNHDIMLKWWELYCELDKNLAIQTSVLTRTPYYKQDYDSPDLTTFLRYCCRDAACTIEIDDRLERMLNPASKKHYHFNLTLLNPLLYMQLRGIKFNRQAAEDRLKDVKSYLYALQRKLNSAAGLGLRTTDKIVLRAIVRDVMCYKKDSSKVKAEYVNGPYDWCMRVLHGDAELSDTEIGRLEIELGMDLNIEGGKFKPFLYETLALPPQKNLKTGNLTSDYEALQKLLNLCKSEHKSIAKSNRVKAINVLPIAIEIGELRTRDEHIQSLIKCSHDFKDDCRLHGSYNEVGSETGRITVSKFLKKIGYPLQTIEDENTLKPIGHPLRLGLREFILADVNCYLAKCDLKGADGWTIGANLAALGESTMLDDLRFGIKPAHILCQTLRHGYATIAGKPRDVLKELFKPIGKEDWDYFASKQCIWGYCYLMGVDKSISHVFKVSEGTVTMTTTQGEAFKSACFKRYRPELWHRATEQRLFKQPYPPKLVSPSGHTRMFFGRKQDIVGEALANEPQEVTTYATNMAVFNCWTDAENRIRMGNVTKLRIEPMHQVHDEFLSQFKTLDTEWATDKIKQWFNNEIVIAGIKITIPFEGTYGINWSMDEQAKKGSI